MTSTEMPDLEPQAALWAGDAGELALDTRRTLVKLLVGPVLDGRRDPQSWAVLEREEAKICSRMNDLFLRLVIDRDQQVAFVAEIDEDELVFPKLIRKKPMTNIETYLFFFLTTELHAAESREERAVISREDIEERLLDLGAKTNDEAGFMSRINAAVRKAEEFGVLRLLSKESGSYEISPVLKLLMTVDVIKKMKSFYEKEPAEIAVNETVAANVDDEERADV